MNNWILVEGKFRKEETHDCVHIANLRESRSSPSNLSRLEDFCESDN
jgi:hypothetical protein